MLTGHGLSALPVLDPDDSLTGMVSERDLLSKQAQPLPGRRHWWQLHRVREEIRRAEGDTVGHVMTGFPVTIAPDASLAEAARRMIEHGLKHLPVIDHAGALVGVGSRTDLIRAFVRSDDEIRDTVANEVFRHVLWVDPTDVEVTVADGIVDVVSALEYRFDDGGIRGRSAHHPRPAGR